MTVEPTMTIQATIRHLVSECPLTRMDLIDETHAVWKNHSRTHIGTVVDQLWNTGDLCLVGIFFYPRYYPRRGSA